MIDSGSERSAVSPAAMRRLGLAPLLDASFAGSGSGVGGSVAKLGRVHYAELAFEAAARGDETAEGPRACSFACAFEVMTWPASARDFEAILGLDFLVRHRAVLDLPAGVMRLELAPAAAAAGAPPRPAEARYVDVPLAYDAEQEEIEARDAGAAAAAAAQLG